MRESQELTDILGLGVLSTELALGNHLMTHFLRVLPILSYSDSLSAPLLLSLLSLDREQWPDEPEPVSLSNP